MSLKIDKCFLDTLRTDMGYEPITDEAPYSELLQRYLDYDYPGAGIGDGCRIIMDEERTAQSERVPTYDHAPAVLCLPIPDWDGEDQEDEGD